MKSPFKRVGVLMLTLVIALSGLGIGYGAWTDTINITGTGSSGSWASVAAWGFTSSTQMTYDGLPFFDGTDVTCKNDGCFYETIPPFEPQIMSLGYNVGTTTKTLKNVLGDDYGNFPSSLLYQRVDVVFDDVYPGYANELNYAVGNGGYYAIDITDMDVDFQFDASGSNPALTDVTITHGANYPLYLDLDGHGDVDYFEGALYDQFGTLLTHQLTAEQWANEDLLLTPIDQESPDIDENGTVDLYELIPAFPGDPTLDFDLAVWDVNMIGSTLNVGQELDSVIRFRVEAGADQDASYMFIVYILGELHT